MVNAQVVINVYLVHVLLESTSFIQLMHQLILKATLVKPTCVDKDTIVIMLKSV